MIVTIILAIGTIVLVVNFYKCYKSNQNPNNVVSERTRVQTNQTNHEINIAEGILFRTQFPSLGIFIIKKVGFRKN